MPLPVIEDRRALHRIPELDSELPETIGYIKRALAGLDCEVFMPIPSAVCAFFDCGFAYALAFRADMDALPIAERTGAPYASVRDGRMHACGHDGHIAMLLELARRVHADKSSVRGNILLIFQPAEETVGGARDICQTGIFDKYSVSAVFGGHLWPDLPPGAVASRKNELMSRSSIIDIEVIGRSSHIAHAETGLDALEAGVEIYTRVRHLERGLDPEIFRVCTFGKLTSGSAGNAISDYTHLLGSLRAFDDDTFFSMQDAIRGICGDVQAASGCTVRLTMSDGYPPVINPPGLLDKIRACVPVEIAELDRPFMTTEDFSWYQRYAPGVFFLIGVGPAPALHSDNFDFDDSLLVKGADFFESIARGYCADDERRK